jgi:hypothetical protein
MQFMSYDSDSGGESVGKVTEKAGVLPAPAIVKEAEVEDNPVPLEWLQGPADSSSDEEDDRGEDIDNKATSSMLQAKKFEDVSLLLSGLTEKPKFLRRSMDEDKFVVAETRRHNYDEADKEHKESRMHNTTKSSSVPPARAPRSAVVPVSAVPVGKTTTTNSASSKSKATDDKESAKVRQQWHLMTFYMA